MHKYTWNIQREKIFGIFLSKKSFNAKNECLTILGVKPRCNLTDMKKADKLIDKLIDNLNDANDFLTAEEKKIKEKTKELNAFLTI